VHQGKSGFWRDADETNFGTLPRLGLVGEGAGGAQLRDGCQHSVARGGHPLLHGRRLLNRCPQPRIRRCGSGRAGVGGYPPANRRHPLIERRLLLRRACTAPSHRRRGPPRTYGGSSVCGFRDRGGDFFSRGERGNWQWFRIWEEGSAGRLGWIVSPLSL
jgi:hypothetical protein